MNTDSAAAIAASKIISMFNVEIPKVRNEFFRIRGDQGLMEIRKREILGHVEYNAQRVVKQYEKDWIQPILHVGSTITATANANEYTFNLSAAALNLDYLEQNITTPYTTANRYKFPIIKNWILALNSNAGVGPQLQVKSFSISGTTCAVIVQHINTNVTLTPGNYGVGSELVVLSNAWSEGSEHPDGLVIAPITDYAYHQTYKTGFKVTGDQFLSPTWFTAYEDGSGNITGYYVPLIEDHEYLHAVGINNALRWQSLAINPIVDAGTDEPNYTTEGDIPYIQRKGHTIPVATGGFNPQFFDYIDKAIDREAGPNYYEMSLGIDRDHEKNNSLKTYFSDSDVPYVMTAMKNDLFGGDEGQQALVNYKALRWGSSRTFGFERATTFSNPRGMGAAGYSTGQMFTCMPLGTKMDRKNTERQLPYMGVSYRKHVGYNTKAEFWTVAGAGPGPDTYVLESDLKKYMWRTKFAALHCGGELMFFGTPE